MSFNWWVDEESCETKRSSFFSAVQNNDIHGLVIRFHAIFLQHAQYYVYIFFSAITCDMLGVDCKCSLNAGSCNNADSNSVCNSASNKCVCKSGYEANENGVCININGKCAYTWSLLSTTHNYKNSYVSWTYLDAVLHLTWSYITNNPWWLLAWYCTCIRAPLILPFITILVIVDYWLILNSIWCINITNYIAK